MPQVAFQIGSRACTHLYKSLFFTAHTAVQAHKPLDPMIFLFDFPFQRVQVSCGMAAMENNVLYLGSTNLIYFSNPFYSIPWVGTKTWCQNEYQQWPPYSQGQSVDSSKTVSTDLPSCQHLRQFGLLSQVIPNSKFWQTNRLFNICCFFVVGGMNLLIFSSAFGLITKIDMLAFSKI